MSSAPRYIKFILLALMLGFLGTLVLGIVSQNPVAFKVAGTCVALAAIIVLVWRISRKSGDA